MKKGLPVLLTCRLKLLPDEDQTNRLVETIHQVNTARNLISRVAHTHKTFHWVKLNNLTYEQVRESSGLPSAMAQCAIRQVSKAYQPKYRKRDKPLKYRMDSAVPMDYRSFGPKPDGVSIQTTEGRVKLSYQHNPNHSKALHNSKWKYATLWRDSISKKWYLNVVVELPDAEQRSCRGILGIDLGVVNLAVDSDGLKHSGSGVAKKCRIFRHRRKNLQKKRTRSAKRKLRKMSGRQARYQRNENHTVSRLIVKKAHSACCGIALEDLVGIRNRIKARRRQRNSLHNWGFAQLQFFVKYKAQALGIAVFMVDARNTSRQCPRCGHIEKANRRSRDEFRCRSCDLTGHADHIAARNIALRARAVWEQPMVAGQVA